jgi:hypothetical protein
MNTFTVHDCVNLALACNPPGSNPPGSGGTTGGGTTGGGTTGGGTTGGGTTGGGTTGGGTTGGGTTGGGTTGGGTTGGGPIVVLAYTPGANLVFTQATSNEAFSALGSGNTTPDIVFNSATSVQVRSERQGPGDGRIYDLYLSDGTVCPILVPHSGPMDNSEIYDNPTDPAAVTVTAPSP